MAIYTDDAGHTVTGRICHECKKKRCSKGEWKSFSEFPSSTHPTTDPTGELENGLHCTCRSHRTEYNQARYAKKKAERLAAKRAAAALS